MNINIIHTLAYTFAFLLLVLVYRTFRKTSILQVLKNAKTRTEINRKRKKAVANGETAFTFERGAVVIYAKTQSRAIHDYQEYRRNLKKEKKAKINHKKS